MRALIREIAGAYKQPAICPVIVEVDGHETRTPMPLRCREWDNADAYTCLDEPRDCIETA